MKNTNKNNGSNNIILRKRSNNCSTHTHTHTNTRAITFANAQHRQRQCSISNCRMLDCPVSALACRTLPSYFFVFLFFSIKLANTSDLLRLTLSFPRAFFLLTFKHPHIHTFMRFSFAFLDLLAQQCACGRTDEK